MVKVFQINAQLVKHIKEYKHMVDIFCHLF